ncbi:MAG TPA: DUF1501 domain-containing protein [Pirellulaceae bacterium]|nr:DUF1501 domain-containing protein [Pirellulaceae bacterium]
MLSRRSFLQGSTLLALAPTVPGFLTRSVLASAEASSDGRILVVIQMDGGNDGINTVVPYADDGYGANRKELRLRTDGLIKIDGEAAFHPSMRAAADLLDDGRLAIVQGVGYPNPNRSHFRSMAIWHTARFEQEEHLNFGWAGRALDLSRRTVGADAIFVGSETLPVALRGRRSVASSMLHAEDLVLTAPINPTTLLTGRGEGNDLKSFVQRTVLDSYTTADELSKAKGGDESSTRYPETQLAERLKLIARLIKSGLPTRVYYAIQSGYDTHAVQLPGHARLLNEFAGAVKALVDDLAAANLADRVAVMAFSEFGRRVQENGSLGTDHGTAGPVFIAGTSVVAGLHGRMPRLLDLDDGGDLKLTVDFRQVYATVIERWLGVSAQPVLDRTWEPLAIFR